MGVQDNSNCCWGVKGNRCTGARRNMWGVQDESNCCGWGEMGAQEGGTMLEIGRAHV